MIKARLSNSKPPLSWPEGQLPTKHFPSKKSCLSSTVSVGPVHPEREPSGSSKLLPRPKRASDSGFDANSLEYLAAQCALSAVRLSQQPVLREPISRSFNSKVVYTFWKSGQASLLRYLPCTLQTCDSVACILRTETCEHLCRVIFASARAFA